jgi:hypothetical protein
LGEAAVSQILSDSFDHYGSGAVSITNMLAGSFAQIVQNNTATGPQCTAPIWGARTGQFCIGNPFTVSVNSNYARRVLPAGGVTTLIAAFGYSVGALPATALRSAPIIFSDASNTAIATLMLNTTGTLSLLDGGFTGNVLLTTAAPVIVPENWHFIEMLLTPGSTGTGVFTLRVDDPDGTGTPVMNSTGLTFTNKNAVAQVQILTQAGGAEFGGADQYIDDLILRDTAGSVNNGFAGDLRVATLFPDFDGTPQGWTDRPRRLFGNGILDNRAANNSLVAAASSTQLDLGTGDFTLEQEVRFFALPTTTHKAEIIGKWDETDNRRSYQLYLGGPSLDSGNLVFRISTDGKAGTVSTVISWPWAPDLNRWYHLAVCRASSETLLFIDGVQQGVPAADANAYFASGTNLAMGGQADGTISVANASFSGFLDEVRVTVGVARYITDFTPPAAAFPRNISGDPYFASVMLLCGFDSGINDESSVGRTLTARNGSVQNTPDDGDFNYQDINQPTPRDDTFIEAALLPAQGVFTLAGLPSANDTVTVGTKDGSTAAAYKFVASVASAFDVAIGADEPGTIANLVAAINAGAGAGTSYGTGTTANFDVSAITLPGPQLQVTANTPGTAGNSIASTTTSANGSWGSTTLTGGADIPTYSEFGFQRLPPETTVINAVTFVSRQFKSDSGTCKTQLSFVGPGGTAESGTENSITTSPSYYQDIFETDPDSSGAISPTSVTGGRVRINRTE